VSRFAENIDQIIRSRSLLEHGQKVLVAVSGGVDSMVLLQVLHELSRRNSWQLTVAHLNHRLRGRNSDADEQFVVRIARALGLRVVVERAEVKSHARANKLSVEMAARKVRHEFLAQTAARLKIRKVALAHHGDDQLELFFLRLLRGSGNEGLAGMKWRNRSPQDRKIELIRPLLDQSRSTLTEFARQKKIRFREDASNASLDIQRNRIRHKLLPLLRRSYQPALDRTLSRVMNIAAEESEVVSDLAAEWLKSKGRGPFKSLPVAIQRRCIQIQLHSEGAKTHRQKVPADFGLVEHLRTKPGQFIKISPESAVMADAEGNICFRESKPVSGVNPAECTMELNNRAKELVFGNTRFRWRILPGKGRGVPKPRVGSEIFDADKIGPRIVLRHWQPGDRFHPIGMSSSVKLQDLFTNRKIPREQRPALVLATTQNGVLFWVEKLRISEQFKVSKWTNRRLQWQWKRL
jgi:tRNA(Ile)-lysidine synthase